MYLALKVLRAEAGQLVLATQPCTSSSISKRDIRIQQQWGHFLLFKTVEAQKCLKLGLHCDGVRYHFGSILFHSTQLSGGCHYQL